MKYLYCPRCKDLKVKSWYQIKNKCQMCFADATPIEIPKTWMTYTVYVLYVVTIALVAVSLYSDIKTYLYAAIVLLAVLFMFSWFEMGRGMAYARSKIKVTSANLDNFRKRGWN